VQTQATNGLAIASLVLSLVWIFGLGSLLAVIFAFVARSQIRARRQGGDGLAIAGMVVGFIGLAVTILWWISLFALVHTVHTVIREATPRTTTVQAGQAVTIQRSRVIETDITSFTAFTVTHPVPPTSALGAPAPGRELAVADIQVCAGAGGLQHAPMTLHSVSLVFNYGAPATIAAYPARQPNLADINSMGANQCVRGFMTFQIASGTNPVAVRYQPDPLHIYVWAL